VYHNNENIEREKKGKGEEGLLKRHVNWWLNGGVSHRPCANTYEVWHPTVARFRQ